MNFIVSLTGRSCLAIILLGGLLAGCSAPTSPPVEPTTDPATYVAAAVQTIQAGMTEEALRNPTNTPLPPTDTPVPPTDTPEPPTPNPTADVSSTPTETEAPALSAKFLYATTYPENKRVYVPNEKYGLALGFQNTGTITWQPGYRLKLSSYVGEITVQPEVELGQAIEPGQKVEFNLWAFGSETLGQHTWYFQLYTGEGIPVPGGVGVFIYESV